MVPPSQSPTTLGRSEETHCLLGRQDSYLAIYGGKGDEKMRQLYIQVNKQEMARQHYHWCGNLKPLLKDKKIYY